jgi:transcriptional regulator with XRE-family HTH domain
MQKALNIAAVNDALAAQGITRKELAERVGVSSQAVTNWMKGKDFPRPAALLKLAGTLRLPFEQLTKASDDKSRPIIAFRKKGSAKTTQTHVAKAEAIGMLLKPLVPYLSEIRAIRPLITSPSADYAKLQTVVSETREHIGLGVDAVLGYEQIIGEFGRAGAVLIPVLWGTKKRHENAMHIRLPEEDVTFIFVNLDTRLEDFKFWMAHELAHVYTPDLTGSEQGEDYADAFAGALLFPEPLAERAYHEAIQRPKGKMVGTLLNHAEQHAISLNTVFQQVQQYSQAKGCAPLPLREKEDIHAVRNRNPGPLISERLFQPTPPSPRCYVAACENAFQSDFYNALRRMVHERNPGPGYLQQVLDIPLLDAKALHEELRH